MRSQLWMRIAGMLLAVGLASGGLFYLFRFRGGKDPDGSRAGMPGSVPAINTLPIQRPRVPVTLKELTGDVEETADVSRLDEALTARLARRLEPLSPEQRRAIFAEVTAQLNRMTEAELKMRTSDDPQKRRAMLLIPALTGLLQRTDPVAILEWSLDPGLSPLWKRKIGRLAAETLGVYGRDQPREALGWMKEHAVRFREADRLGTWAATLAGVAFKDLPLALEEVRNQGLPGHILEAMVPAISTTPNKSQWIDAVSGLTDPQERGRNWSGLLREEIQSQGWEQAYALLQTQLPGEALTPDNLRRISQEALTHAPSKFATNLTLLQDPAKLQILPDFIGRWTERDYNAAATWLRNAPADAPWRDAAVEALAGKISGIDPEAARAWQATRGRHSGR